jgi:hypothetical protein
MRIKQGRLDPTADDLEDSKRTSKDCNTMIAVFDPFDAGIADHKDYNVARLAGKYRQLGIVKNRDGERGGFIGTHFLGKIGMFMELPPPKPRGITKAGVQYMTDNDYEQILAYGN